MPVYLTIFKDRGLVPDERGCLKSLNSFAEYHNEYLQRAIQDLKKSYPDIAISYGDYYNPYLTLIDKADDYGKSSPIIKLMNHVTSMGGSSEMCGIFSMTRVREKLSSQGLLRERGRLQL